ncbi:hypothetical protein Val02_66380 [Virgisporangium aliadipatigenens]|uniref:TrbC/VIRB2 family protein n=2 Tax=Virgisporangium aliadipatigenens TaxID=741659 RepID=A0A8J4DV32_9ACTN|nr:hypothetical protein Val02_66380 [Virgisporangium aliadipatigenens]
MFVVGIAVAATVSAVPEAAYAAEPHAAVVAVESIDQVLNNMRAWLMGLLGAWVALCATVGWFRYTSGESDEVERGKRSLRYAGLGFIGAMLTPLIIKVLTAWVA